MIKTTILSLLVPIFLLITLVTNALAATGALGGIPTGEVSDQYPVLFTPAGYTFGIWSLIYAGLFAFTIYSLFPEQFAKKSLSHLRIMFIITCILNSLWIVAWQYGYLVASLGIMCMLLLSLIRLYNVEGIGIKKATKPEKWFIEAPFSLYLGWISVATIANLSIVLYDTGWYGFGLGEVVWTSAMMSVAVLLALAMLHKRRDYIFAGVVVWALIGIAVKNQGLNPIVITTAVGTLMLVAYTSYRLASHK